MRPSCLDCCRKHLAQAEVLMLEARKGYIAHAWLAVGHMAEAEDETIDDFPELTARIREERLKYMETINDFKNENYLESLYALPTLELIEDVTDLYRELQFDDEDLNGEKEEVSYN